MGNARPGRRSRGQGHEVDLSDAEIERRLEEREEPEPPYETGVLAKYTRDFGSAANGAVTNPGVQWE